MSVVIEPSKMPIIQAKIEQAWADSRANQDTNLVAVAPTLKGLCNMSNLKVPNLILNRKDRKPEFEVAWMSACSNNPEILTDKWVRDIPCDFTGWQIGTSKQKMAVTTIIRDAFAVPYMVYDNLYTNEELFRQSYMLCVKGILEKANSLAIAKMVTYAGLNKMQKGMGVAGLTGVNAWNLTKVPAMNLHPQSFNSYVAMLQRMNKMVKPKVFTGGALEVSENVTGSLEEFKFGGQTVYSDMENFPAQGLDNDMFVVATGAIGVVNTFNYELSSEIKWNQVKPLGGDLEMYYAETLPAEFSPNGMPLVVDITKKFVKREIAQNQYGNLAVDNRCEWVEVYNLELKLDFMLNPLACEDKATGVVRIKSDSTLPVFLSPTQLVQTVQHG
jgi:hypothetical protein